MSKANVFKYFIHSFNFSFNTEDNFEKKYQNFKYDFKQIDLTETIFRGNENKNFSKIDDNSNDLNLNSLLTLYNLKTKKNSRDLNWNFKETFKTINRKIVVKDKINSVWSEEKKSEKSYFENICFPELKFFLRIELNQGKDSHLECINFSSNLNRIGNIIFDSVFNSRFIINEMNDRFNFKRQKANCLTSCIILF
jgi:hypothetical protein